MKTFSIAILLITAFFIVISCSDEEQDDLASVVTNAASSITSTTAVSGGTVNSDGGAKVKARGVCWDTITNPTLADSATHDGTGTGSFVSHLTGLLPNKTYYVRAYATNSEGTAYGNVLNFKTTDDGGNTVTDIDGNVYNTIAIGYNWNSGVDG